MSPSIHDQTIAVNNILPGLFYVKAFTCDIKLNTQTYNVDTIIPF